MGFLIPRDIRTNKISTAVWLASKRRDRKRSGPTPPPPPPIPPNGLVFYDFKQSDLTKAITEIVRGEQVLQTTRAADLNVVQSSSPSIISYGADTAGFDVGVGMLVEKDSRNYLPVSVPGFGWIKRAAIVLTENATTAPDGTNNATLVENIKLSDNPEFLAEEAASNSFVNSEKVVGSTWVKANGNAGDTVDFYVKRVFPNGGLVQSETIRIILSNDWQEIKDVDLQLLPDNTSAGIYFLQNETTTAESMFVSYTNLEIGTKSTSPMYSFGVSSSRDATISEISTFLNASETEQWPVNDFVLSAKVTVLEDAANLDANPLNNQIFSSFTDNDNYVRCYLNKDIPDRVRLRVNIDGGLTTIDVALGSPILSGDELQVIIEKTTDILSLSVNSEKLENPLTSDIVWSDKVRLSGIQQVGYSVRSLWESFTIQSPIPPPPPVQGTITLQSGDGGNIPVGEVAYFSPSTGDPYGSVDPEPYLVSGTPLGYIYTFNDNGNDLIISVFPESGLPVGKDLLLTLGGREIRLTIDIDDGAFSQNADDVAYLRSLADTPTDFSMQVVDAIPSSDFSSNGDFTDNGDFA